MMVSPVDVYTTLKNVELPALNLRKKLRHP